jgi:hypothetical protein
MDEMDTKNPNSGMREDYMCFMLISRQPKDRSTMYYHVLISSSIQEQSKPSRQGGSEGVRLQSPGTPFTAPLSTSTKLFPLSHVSDRAVVA